MCETVKRKLARRGHIRARAAVRDPTGEASSRRDLFFDVTKRRVLGIDNSMDSGSKAARSISVVVPVYNSELILPALIKRLEPVLASRAGQYELVLVNDGSRDQSWKVIQEQSRSHPWVRGINLMRNYGQHNALLCGIRAARFDTLVTMDDDLQHPPEEIPNYWPNSMRDLRWFMVFPNMNSTVF